MSLTNLVLDNNNNAYIYVKVGLDYKLISIGSDGKPRWSKTLANGQYNTNGSVGSGLQMLLTGNTETLVFNNLNNQKPTIQLYNTNGTLSKNIDGGFYDGVIAYALDDAKIDTHGNLVMNLDDEILSAKLNLAPIGPNSLSYSKGTNGNTNSLNK
jgi:hypothetical protein